MKLKRINDFLPEVKDLYVINENGSIYSETKKGYMNLRNKKGTEYKLVNLMLNNGKKKTFRVHRLVAMAFIPKTSINSEDVNHKDGNKSNNNVRNLEWVTKSENQIHAYQNGLNQARKGAKSNFSKLSKKEIEEIFLLKKQGLTQLEISKKFNCTRSNISYILNKKTWK